MTKRSYNFFCIFWTPQILTLAWFCKGLISLFDAALSEKWIDVDQKKPSTSSIEEKDMMPRTFKKTGGYGSTDA